MQADGAILAAGAAVNSSLAGSQNFAAVRLTPDGEFDASFGIAGKSYGTFASSNNVFESATSLAIGNGGLMIAGNSNNRGTNDARFGIARLTLDKVFASGFDN